jgi:hypothetical protein
MGIKHNVASVTVQPLAKPNFTPGNLTLRLEEPEAQRGWLASILKWHMPAPSQVMVCPPRFMLELGAYCVSDGRWRNL